jgi:hypothetical protein
MHLSAVTIAEWTRLHELDSSDKHKGKYILKEAKQDSTSKNIRNSIILRKITLINRDNRTKARRKPFTYESRSI